MKTLVTLALGLIGFSVYSNLRHQHRLQSGPGVKAEPLQRWEDEGGNVPAANHALAEARSDDLLAPSAQDDALLEPVAGKAGRTPGISGSSLG